MKVTTNSYGGLNQDMSKDSVPNTHYIDALDVRISTSRGESQGSITNIKGNKLSFTIPQIGLGVCEIIGSTAIRNTIILFVADDSSKGGWIYKIIYNENGETIDVPLTLVYTHPDLNFSKFHPIEAIGRFESFKNQKIYWTDYNQDLRSLNIASPSVLTTDINLINIHPNITYTQPQLTNISGGGSLLTGLYQIAYRLITYDGKQTLISPPSNMIHVVSDSESTASTVSYSGDPKGTNTFKSLTISIDVSDYHNFEKIELISLFHEDYLGTPAIKSIETQLIPTGNTFTFTYTGSEPTIQPITTTDFALKNYAFSTCKTLTQVDNSLLIANLKATSFEIQERLAELNEKFDAKTYRYKNVSSVITKNTDVFNVEYNKDALWDIDWDTNSQYKFKANGTTLGGQGLNISYTFHTEQTIIDESTVYTPGTLLSIPYSGVTPHNLSDGYTNTNRTFDSQASPYISGLLKGYKRGETYRFGIVFYNKKGESSFVEYIGDIKFPDISDTDDILNSTGGYNYEITTSISDSCAGHHLGIKFNIDFSTCPNFLNEITGYQIVRVDRKTADKKRICSGVLKTFSLSTISSSVPSGGYDLRINGSDQVLHLAQHQYSLGNINRNGDFDYINSSGVFQVGTHLTVYSPEISFDFDDVANTISGDGNACILITGGLTLKNSLQGSRNTSSVEKLGIAATDNTLLYHASKILTDSYKKYQDIRTFSNKQKVKYSNSMSDLDADIAIHTPLYDGYYMRNFYAHSFGGGDLNNASTSSCYLYKGATGITGSIQKISTDPLNGNALTYLPLHDYFDKNYTYTASTADKVMIDIVLPRQEVYGGYSQSALENNVFIPASPFIKKSNTTPIVYGGDINIQMFVFQSGSTYNNRKYFDDATSGNQIFKYNYSITELFPVESCVNLDLNYGSTLKNGVTYNVGSGAIDKLWRQETNNSSSNTNKSLKMYDYNSVYSEIGTDLSFFVKPQDLVLNNTNDIRAMLSNVKINDEIIDSWSNFAVNNYWDVDDRGPINKVLKWKNLTYFFQDNAVGNYLINPVSIINDNNGQPVNLGTGTGIVKHQYISTENGAIHQYGVLPTDTGIYYFDVLARKIFMLGQGNNPLSEVKGIHGLLNTIVGKILLRKENGGDNPIKDAGITTVRDNVNDEILFTFRGTTLRSVDDEDFIIVKPKSFTIVYDELLGEFSSFYSATPSTYITNKNILLSPNPDSRKDVYIHNKGDYGSFYGNLKESYVTLVVNPESDLNKVLRFIEFNSIVRDANKNIDRGLTVTAFKIDTETQTTGKVLFSIDRFKHKFNKWRLKIPRDQNSTSKQGRLRNTYFIVTLYFDNTSNKELILNRLLTYYDDQMF